MTNPDSKTPANAPEALKRMLRALLYAIALFCGGATAQEYPVRPVRVVVPFPPGGSTDVVARLISQRLGERLGQPVVIENRPGANGGIGAALVAKAEPDGYTLLFGGTGTNAISHAMNPNLPYDSEKDFVPISLAVNLPLILVVPTSSQTRTFQDLVSVGRSGANVNFASVGIGSASHLAGELFNLEAGTRFVHVPYKGGAPALLATMTAEVTMMFNTGLEIAPHVRSGKLRAIGVSTSRRSPVSPEIPTLAELGLPAFDTSAWFGVFAPAGTPRAVVERLNRDLVRVLSDPDTGRKFGEVMAVPAWNTPEQFAALLRADIAKYRRIVKERGISAN